MPGSRPRPVRHEAEPEAGVASSKISKTKKTSGSILVLNQVSDTTGEASKD
jgi:hypothetical protein